MRLPGFTADKALYEKGEIYEGKAIPAAMLGAGDVVPQFWRCMGDYCCTDLGGSPYCVRVRGFLM